MIIRLNWHIQATHIVFSPLFVSCCFGLLSWYYVFNWCIWIQVCKLLPCVASWFVHCSHAASSIIFVCERAETSRGWLIQVITSVVWMIGVITVVSQSGGKEKDFPVKSLTHCLQASREELLVYNTGAIFINFPNKLQNYSTRLTRTDTRTPWCLSHRLFVQINNGFLTIWSISAHTDALLDCP